MTLPERVPAYQALEETLAGNRAQMVAFLTSVSGDISASEDALSDATVAALRTWPTHGVPQRQTSWLVTVARRSLIDAARRRETAEKLLPEIARQREMFIEPDGFEWDVIPDKRLELLFACAHPAIDASMRSPLMLQTVLGLDAAAIAASFLTSPTTMAQRLVRVKAKIRQARIPFAVPTVDELPARIEAVLDAIYVAYSTGWGADDDTTATSINRVGLLPEAIRLAEILCALLPKEAEAHGLLALLLHSSARIGSRRDERNAFVPLDKQRVGDWDPQPMLRAEDHLRRAQSLKKIGPYQLHAAIQSVHNRRAVTGQTDWLAIADLYEGLVAISPTIGAYVARAKATIHTRGPDIALQQLLDLPADRVMNYQPYWVVLAHTHKELGRREAASAAAAHAIGLTDNSAVRDHLREQYPEARP